MEIKFFNKKKKFAKGGLIVKPEQFWRYILSAFFVLFFLICLLGWQLFRKVENDSMLPIIKVDEKEAIKKDRIDKAVEFFKEREKKSAEILSSPSPVGDPSL